MRHYIVAYVNKNTGDIGHIAVSDGPIKSSHLENKDEFDIHFCEGELIGEGNNFIRGRRFIESLALENGKLCFKSGHQMNNEMILSDA